MVACLLYGRESTPYINVSRKTNHAQNNITRLMAKNCEEKGTHVPVFPMEKLSAILEESVYDKCMHVKTSMGNRVPLKALPLLGCRLVHNIAIQEVGVEGAMHLTIVST